MTGIPQQYKIRDFRFHHSHILPVLVQSKIFTLNGLIISFHSIFGQFRILWPAGTRMEPFEPLWMFPGSVPYMKVLVGVEIDKFSIQECKYWVDQEVI